MMSSLLLVILLGVICTSKAVTITKCRAADSACIKQSAQSFVPVLAEGIPELGVKSLDPLTIAKIDSSTPDLKLVATGIVVKGMKNCEISAVSREKAKHTLNVDVLCTVDVQGEYEIKGKVLVLPIDGSGHLSVQLYKILISVESHLKDVERNGKKYWSIDKWDYTWDLKDRAKIELVDLFAGSPELSKAMTDLMGESSTEIVKEVGPPIVKAITSEVVDAIKHLYSQVPVDELALD